MNRAVHDPDARSATWLLEQIDQSVAHATTLQVHGRITQAVGQVLRAALPNVRLGELCHLHTPGLGQPLEAEVVGFLGDEALLSPVGDMMGVGPATIAIPSGRGACIEAGSGLLGRVLDGNGKPIDGLGPLRHVDMHCPVYRDAPSPLARQMISTALPTGVRAIDGLLACAQGQRLGVFAAAGGGKSTLLGMLARGADADVVVIGLIGERGREVREFLEHELGAQGTARSVVVCATSERSSMERARAAFVCTAIAEYFRDRGQRVLLLMDSVTRFARALREIGLAAGEPPARRGFPPSVFAALPRLLERAGNAERGSITAFYTILVEGDDMNEPVADETRSILDGHIVLSRKLAAANHYPAIDVLQSVSRVMRAVAAPEHNAAAGRLRELLAKYDEVETLVRLGEYQAGSDAAADKAIARIDGLRRFLRQRPEELVPHADTLRMLQEVTA